MLQVAEHFLLDLKPALGYKISDRKPVFFRVVPSIQFREPE